MDRTEFLSKLKNTFLIERIEDENNNSKRTLLCRGLTVLFFALFAVLTAYYVPLRFEDEIFDLDCHKDFTDNEKLLCRAQCERGKFSLSGMSLCHPWLNCHDIEEHLTIKNEGPLSQGVVKKIHFSKWQDFTILLSRPRTPDMRDDFKENIINLEYFSPDSKILQLIGQCNRTILLTEYHSLGNALNFPHLIQSSLSKYNTMLIRMQLCVDYVSIIRFLHSFPEPRVMCDSNTLEKTLTQYMLTKNLRLVLADLDALPKVLKDSGILCGSKEILGSFAAPEQLWPYPDIAFNNSLMPNYNEKTDIWKIPDVCNWFLGNEREADTIKFRLFDIHKQCKNLPSLRPSAADVYQEYENLLNDLNDEQLIPF